MSLATIAAWCLLLMCSLFPFNEGCHLTQIASLRFTTFVFPQLLNDQQNLCVHFHAKDKRDIIKVTITISRTIQNPHPCPFVIQVFDGSTSNATVLFQDCGSSTNQELKSSGPDILVEVGVDRSAWNNGVRLNIAYQLESVTSSSYDLEGVKTSSFGTTEVIPLVAVPILVLVFAFIACSKRRKNQQLRQNLEADGPTAEDLLQAVTATLEQNGASCCRHDPRQTTISVLDSHNQHNGDPFQKALNADQRRKVCKGRVRHPAGDVRHTKNNTHSLPHPNVFQTDDPSSVPFLSPYDSISNMYDSTSDPETNLFHNNFHDNKKTEDNLDLVTPQNGNIHYTPMNEHSTTPDSHHHHDNHHRPHRQRHRQQSNNDINSNNLNLNNDEFDSTKQIAVAIERHSPSPVQSRHRRHSPNPGQGRHHSPRPDASRSPRRNHQLLGNCRNNLDDLSSSSNSVLTYYGQIDQNPNVLTTSTGTLMTSSGTDVSLLDRNINSEALQENNEAPPSYEEVTCGGRLAPLSTKQS